MENIFWDKKKEDDRLIAEIKNLSSSSPSSNDIMSNLEPFSNLSNKATKENNFNSIQQETNLNLNNNDMISNNISSKNNFKVNNSNELPSFEDNKVNEMNNSDSNDDLLVPTPPPSLMQNREPDLTLKHLEEAEEEFNRTRIKPLDNYGYEKKEIDSHKPIFIKIDNYEITLKNIIDVKTIVREFNEILFRVENVHESQNNKFSSLHKTIEDIQRKLIYVDNTIFER